MHFTPRSAIPPRRKPFSAPPAGHIHRPACRLVRPSRTKPPPPFCPAVQTIRPALPAAATSTALRYCRSCNVPFYPAKRRVLPPNFMKFNRLDARMPFNGQQRIRSLDRSMLARVARQHQPGIAFTHQPDQFEHLFPPIWPASSTTTTVPSASSRLSRKLAPSWVTENRCASISTTCWRCGARTTTPRPPLRICSTNSRRTKLLPVPAPPRNSETRSLVETQHRSAPCVAPHPILDWPDAEFPTSG
jgi:hypothetical protein